MFALTGQNDNDPIWACCEYTMKDLFRSHLIQIIIIFLVLLLFLGNASGLLEINLRTGPLISVHTITAAQAINYLPVLSSSKDFMLLLITGIALAALLPVLSPIKASLLAIVCVIPPILLNLYGGNKVTQIPMEFSLLTVLVMYSVNALIAYFRETHAKQKIIEVFGQYVPPEIVSEISKHPGGVSLSGESRKLTVFFCDLQNFTGASEQLNPKQLASLLNEYLSAMSEILFKYGATIDKYIGDSIMAFWGAPLVTRDHARKALLASFEMQSKISELSVQFINKGWPGPNMGIGINTGMMNVGNMGSRYRIAYTVVGDAVNLASRLEGLTRTYHVPTIISEAVKQECEDILYRELDVVQVKGKHKLVRIFQPLCLLDDVDNTLHRQMIDHEQGIAYYHNEYWEDARAVFKQLAMERKDDGYYPVMIQKIDDIVNS